MKTVSRGSEIAYLEMRSPKEALVPSMGVPRYSASIPLMGKDA